MTVPLRLRWAAELLDPRPDHRLLEVGCGPGVLACLLCERLTAGVVVASDRSATAIERTRARCSEHVASGRLLLRQQALADLDLPDASVDTAFSVDVNVFWTDDAAAELVVLRRVLVPGGRLAVLYGSASPQGASLHERVLGPVAEAVRRAGFGDVRVVDEADGCGVLAKSPDGPGVRT
jgi:ubiquinone/menaquinone biosynthesis C-methylase UbiE